MSHLPLVHMTLYKHGVGFFQRRGPVSGESLKLTFRREEMDDLLKSLTVIDLGGGTVRGVDYDTPQSQQERLAGCSITLDDARSLRDLLMDLQGRTVRLLVGDGSNVAGTLIGLDLDGEKPLESSLVSLWQADSRTVAVFPLSRLEGVELLDETAAGDLRFFLETATGQETHRSITIRLSPGEHDLAVSYIAPAPTWRVSYRLVVDAAEADRNEAERRALLQGWGIFDNRLEEDLTDISLSLTAGMPISFLYDLYTPHTPERPVVQDEDRVAAGPVEFKAAVAEDSRSLLQTGGRLRKAAPRPGPMALSEYTSRASVAAAGETVKSAATGAALGELFQYNVEAPVTVGRGQSAMVPIVSSELGVRKDLIYNRAKMPDHPVATIRFKNSTDLTLERGPVTVLDGGEYVGEAVLPFTVTGAEAIISYAVELGVRIEQETKIEHQLHALHLKDAFLIQQRYSLRRTIYRLDNRTAEAKIVLIEHQRAPRFEFFDTPEPSEKTLDTYRYRVEAPSGKLTEFVVQERQLHHEQVKLQDLSYGQLQNFLENKFLDKSTYDQLKEILDGWAAINKLEDAFGQLMQRRSSIFDTQAQVQQNMSGLAQTGEEGKLRGRYVQKLAASEEELAELGREAERLQLEKKKIQEEVQAKLKALVEP